MVWTCVLASIVVTTSRIVMNDEREKTKAGCANKANNTNKGIGLHQQRQAAPTRPRPFILEYYTFLNTGDH